MAYAMKLRGDDMLALCFFGEGTSSEGDFHVGLNFAGVWRAPAIFFCRNNGYAISTPVERTTAVADIASRASGYGIRGAVVDGNDVLAVIKAVREASAHARAGLGPTLLEAKTYRLAAHSTSDDPRGYRASEEEAYWRKRDPLLRLRVLLESRGLWDDQRETTCTESASSAVIAALEIAEGKSHPPVDSLFDDVFETLPPLLIEQRRELRAHIASGKATYRPT
jgi:2-oxoisovalerate dehydrogenase E1 component alpha subunit